MRDLTHMTRTQLEEYSDLLDTISTRLDDCFWDVTSVSDDINVPYEITTEASAASSYIQEAQDRCNEELDRVMDAIERIDTFMSEIDEPTLAKIDHLTDMLHS